MDTPPSPSGQPQSTEPPKQWTVGRRRAELVGHPGGVVLVVDVRQDRLGVLR